MDEELRMLASSIAKGIALENAYARELTRAAAALEISGRTEAADALRSFSLTRRINELKLQERLATLWSGYAQRFRGQTHTGP